MKMTDTIAKSAANDLTLDHVRLALWENFGSTPSLIEAVIISMAIMLCLCLKDLPHCVGLVILGPPSGGKTTILKLFEGLVFTYLTNKFSPKAFVSHYAAAKEEQLSEIDLLPKIRGKVLLIPELAPTFGARMEDLLENISTLTSIFDGRGHSNDTGTKGHRGYRGDYRFAMIGALAYMPHRTWQVMGTLGTRWVFYVLDEAKSLSDQELVDLAFTKPYADKIANCTKVIHPFLSNRWNELGGFSGFEWKAPNDPQLLMRLARASQLSARWRGLIQRQDEQGFNPAVVEEPRRLLTTLYAIARGLALLDGREYLTKEDIATAETIAFASMPEDRRRVFHALTKGGTLTTDEVAKAVGCSKPTALKLMDEWNTLSLVEKFSQDNTTQIKLK
jgi:energy-coupling factor transporter ATP-binding protein EcfA2